MELSSIIFLALLVITWIGIIIAIVYYVFLKSAPTEPECPSCPTIEKSDTKIECPSCPSCPNTGKYEPEQGLCPVGYKQFGRNNSLCCNGTISEWDEKERAYMKCDNEQSEFGICKLSPNNSFIGKSYCYNNNNVCKDSQELWNAYSEKQRIDNKKVFETINNMYNCGIKI